MSCWLSVFTASVRALGVTAQQKAIIPLQEKAGPQEGRKTGRRTFPGRNSCCRQDRDKACPCSELGGRAMPQLALQLVRAPLPPQEAHLNFSEHRPGSLWL